MGSRRRGRDTIKPWLSARLDCKEGRFVQVGNSLLLSKEFQALTAGARFLYLCIQSMANLRQPNEYSFCKRWRENTRT